MARRVLSHTADAGLEASAPTLAALIEELAAGMFELIASDATPNRELTVEVAASTPEDLVVDVLSELLYRSEVDDMVLGSFSVEQPDRDTVTVIARGCDAQTAELTGTPIKAVTYHDLVVRETDAGWFGRVYFDV